MNQGAAHDGPLPRGFRRLGIEAGRSPTGVQPVLTAYE